MLKNLYRNHYFMPQEQSTLDVGDDVEGYQIKKFIRKSKSGMETYLAENAREDSLAKGMEVVLKLFPQDANIERCQYGLQALMSLNHPSIQRVTSVGENYYILTYYPGATLDEKLSKYCARADSPQSYVQHMLSIHHQVISALEYAHRKGILHRDISPSSVIIAERRLSEFARTTISGTSYLRRSTLRLFPDPNRRLAVLSDFDLAKEAQPGVGLSAGFDLSSIGTQDEDPYVAPELKEGRGYTHLADLYSFGAMLNHCLKTVSLEEMPDLKLYVNTLLQPDPQKRFYSAEEAREALEGIVKRRS